MAFCKLCKKDVNELTHDITHFVMEFICKQNPDWVAEDGACEQCLTYYQNLDKVVEITSQEE